MLSQLDSQRLIALFFLACVSFNFPLLGLWDRNLTWLGVPAFPAAIFVLWFVLIAAMAWLMESSSQGQQDH